MERADRGFLELNLLLLLCVSLVPWPTELLAAYLQDGEQATTAAIVYGLAMTAMSAAFAATWAYLRRRPALAAAALRPRLGSAARRSLVGPAAYLVGTALAPLVPVAAFAVFGGVAVFFLVSNRSAGALPA